MAALLSTTLDKNLLLQSFGADIDQLKPHLASTVFKAGQVIKHQGEVIEAVYFPTRGLISSRITLETGHEIECSLIGWTNAVGAIGAMGLDRSDSSRFVCLTDGHAWKIPLLNLVAAARRQPSLARELQLFALAQLGYAVHVGVCNALHTADQRLVRWLATAAELLGGPEIRLSQEELASVLGLQRSAVNPALQRLKAGGLLEVTRGKIRILHAERFERRACECRGRLKGALHLEGYRRTDSRLSTPLKDVAISPTWMG